MTESGSQPAPRARTFATEFAIIVLGILAALSLEAAWSETQTRRDEAEALEQLATDFRSNQQRLDTAWAQHERGLDASYELLAEATGIGTRSSDQSLTFLLNDAISVWTFDPVLGGLNSLIQSGRLGILRSDELRVALAAWPDIVADYRENEEEEWRNYFEEVAPFLREKGVNVGFSHAIGTFRKVGVGPEPDYSDLLADPLFAGLMADRIQNLHLLMDEGETVRQATDAIVEMLTGG